MKKLIGRNKNVRDFKEGRDIFRKELLGNSDDINRRMDNLKLWDRINSASFSGSKYFTSPQLIKVDENLHLVEYEWKDGVSLAEIYEGSFNTGSFFNLPPKEEEVEDGVDINCLLKYSSKALRAIHGFSVLGHEDLTIGRMQADRGVRLAFPIATVEYASLTGAEVQAVALLHRDSQIRKAASILVQERKKADFVFSHGDMRLDQFLYDQSLNDERLVVVDFEELTLAPREYDLAGLLGSILFTELLHAISDSNLDDVDFSDLDGVLEQKIRFAFNKYRQREKLVLASYSSAINEKLLTMEISWFMIERILSRAKFGAKLSSADRSIFGIARRVFIGVS